MVLFSIHWIVSDVKENKISDLKLNQEWTVLCFWRGEQDKSLKPHTLEFRRVSTADEINISGKLYHGNRVTWGSKDWQMFEKGPKLQFSSVMKSGTSSVGITLDAALFGVFAKKHFVSGYVNIDTIDILEPKDCRKYTHLIELSHDLGSLLEPETRFFTDVNIKCGKACIPAHKAILSARSPVFAAMFKNPMKENKENKVVISDIDASVLQLMLTYMYKGTLSGLTVPLASNLLFAADKYQLGDLKKLCCEFLEDNISLENGMRIVYLGELHCSDLKSIAIDYISKTCADLSVLEDTEEWEAIRKERPDLTVEILTSMVKQKENKKN